MANPTKKALSKNLTQMKFMQRASHSLDKDQTDGSGGLIEKWVAPNVPPPPEGMSKVKVVEYSFAECEGLNLFGRFSYNKFNKEVERLSQLLQKPEQEEEGSDEERGTISAQEMAKRYELITSRKLLGKHPHPADSKEDGNKRQFNREVIIDKDGFMKPM